MDNLVEETLKKIDDLLLKQENEKDKMLQEIRSDLIKLNASSEAEKAQVPYEETDQEAVANFESIDTGSEEVFDQNPEPDPEPELEPDEPILISVTGATSRMGTTHCAISIAHYLMRNNKKVAVMELNESGQFAAMGRYFVQASEDEFLYNNVKYYAGCSLQILDNVAAAGKYDFLILDLGSYSAEKTLFLRSDVKFIVSHGRPWELENLILVFKEINKKILSQTNFIFNFVPESGKEEIAAGMSDLGQVYFSAYIEDPFEEIDENIEEILKEYVQNEEIPEETADKKTKKVSSIFRRNKHEKIEKRRKRKNNIVQAVSAAE